MCLRPVLGCAVVPSPTQRDNPTWLAALEGDGPEAASAVGDLERVLRAVIRRTGGAGLKDHDVADLMQESLARVLASLERFRGDSAFTTWAAAIAVRTTLSELRRRAVRARHGDGFAEAAALADQLACQRTPRPDQAAGQLDLLEALRRAIAEQLTARQRTAILAELRGVPLVEIARRLGSNRNAVYKLTHDARLRLRRALSEQGFADEVLSAYVARSPA